MKRRMSEKTRDYDRKWIYETNNNNENIGSDEEYNTEKPLNVILPDTEAIRQRLYSLRSELEYHKFNANYYDKRADLTQMEITRCEKRLYSYRHI